MTAAEIRDQDVRQLREQLTQLRRERFNLRFQKATGQLESTNRVRQVRRDIARILTELGGRERARAAEAAVAAKASAASAAPASAPAS